MLGFTRSEKNVLLFLIIGFLIGTCVWGYRTYFEPLPEIQNVQSSGFDREDTKLTDDFQISVNHAAQEDFEKLPGIGPVIAKRIITHREKHEQFKKIEDLLLVKGIGIKTLERIKPYLNLN